LSVSAICFIGGGAAWGVAIWFIGVCLACARALPLDKRDGLREPAGNGRQRLVRHGTLASLGLTVNH
jgi:hypothetical protein